MNVKSIFNMKMTNWQVFQMREVKRGKGQKKEEKREERRGKKGKKMKTWKEKSKQEEKCAKRERKVKKSGIIITNYLPYIRKIVLLFTRTSVGKFFKEG